MLAMVAAPLRMRWISADSDTPREFHCGSWLEARREADRRKADPAWAGLVNRVERSSYGRGFVVRSVPVDKIIEEGRLAPSVSYKDL